MKTYELWFTRRGSVGHTGPENEFIEMEASSMTAAKKAGRDIAKRNGWRFIEAEDKTAVNGTPDALLKAAQSAVSKELGES